MLAGSQTRPLDTQVSLGEAAIAEGDDSRCLCFVCRHFFSGARPNMKRSATTTTVVNCNAQHQNKTAAPVSINLEDGQVPGDKSKDNDGEESIGNNEEQAVGTDHLDDVRRDFITLIRHNKLQYFFIGTLILSVINACSMFSSIANFSSDTFKRNSSYYGPIVEELPVKIIIGFNLGVFSILLAATSSLTYLFDHKPRKHTWCCSKSSSVSTIAALTAALAIFYLQSVFHSFMVISGHSSSKSAQEANLKSLLYGTSFHWTSLELVSASLIYIQPLLLEGGPLRGRRIGSLASLPPITMGLLTWLAIKVYLDPSSSPNGGKSNNSDDAIVHLMLKLAAYLLIPLLFGLLRRWEFIWTVIESTFAGANQLIEAKVSLEHQRQQQETLLLSVLPAYVAAQVKRNMLKTGSTTTTATTTAQTTCINPANSGDASAAQPASGCPLMHSASAVVQPHPHPANLSVSQPTAARSRSVDESSPTGTQTSASQPGGRLVTTLSVTSSNQRSRNPSFALSELLTSRLASGAAYLSETLAPSTANHLSSSSKSDHQFNAAPNQHQFTPVPSQPSAQARRGFNELYIRTYNNVSLLYGDIVGFTRLCTQLSSWQLVRVLNDLFSHFDRLAERHKIMRIKILGDCYYGVSGIPEFAVMGAKSRASRNDNHAINCVNMGLDMIQYIRQLNIERQQQLPSSNQEPRKEPVIVVSSPTALGGTPELVVAPPAAPGQDLVSGQSSPLPAFELNMRIGIHSGHIHSGVIGLKKWQFDVWSNDVSIAMHCESSGTAGRVQVTEATIQQLNGAFSYERAPGCDRDPFLAAKDTRTYLIRDRISPSKSTNPTLQVGGCGAKSDLQQNRYKLARERARKMKVSGQNSCESKGGEQLEQENNIRSATIGTIKQTLLSSDDNDDGSGLAFNYMDIKPLSLSFQDPAMSRLYAARPVENLAQEMLAFCLVITLLHLVNQQLLIPINCPLIIAIICVVLTSLLLLVALANRQPRKVACQLDELLNAEFPPASPIGSQKNGDFRQVISGNLANNSSNLLARHLSSACERLNNILRPIKSHRSSDQSPKVQLGFRLAADGLASLAVIIFQCYTLIYRFSSTRQTVSCEMLLDTGVKERNEMTVILLLMLLDSSTNLVSYKTKSVLLMIIITCQSTRLVILSTIMNFALKDCLQIRQQTCAEWSSGALLIIMALWSLFYAHQLEYTNKANFLWRNRLNVDHEELEYISGINKVLLENILPSHVVQHYLTHPSEQQHESSMTRSTGELPGGLLNYMRMSFSNIRNNDPDSNKLYHEQHDGVAVMFASIPHFYEFYDESDISKQGLGCIALLNEIICDFDKLLLKNKFSRIEKIKTIGSTYMAAAGLRPCNLSGARNSTASQASVASSQSPRTSPGPSGPRLNQLQSQLPVPSSVGAASTCNESLNEGASERRLALSQQKQNLICMIQFASNLMTALNGINKQSFQVFKLRVGVNTGPVVAGVIGAQRPFYDIWGDCVNIASRMESLGEVGRIQVEEKTAKLLLESLCTENRLINKLIEAYSIVRRGPIDVKGKGGMVTYFVDRKEATVATDEPLKDTLPSLDLNHHHHHHQINRADLPSGPKRNNSGGVIFDSPQETN